MHLINLLEHILCESGNELHVGLQEIAETPGGAIPGEVVVRCGKFALAKKTASQLAPVQPPNALESKG